MHRLGEVLNYLKEFPHIKGVLVYSPSTEEEVTFSSVFPDEVQAWSTRLTEMWLVVEDSWYKWTSANPRHLSILVGCPREFAGMVPRWGLGRVPDE
jgi:hypothetical protein